MASLPRALKPLDYTAYLKTPEIKQRYDIVDGEFRFMAPAPDLYHQDSVGDFFSQLKSHVKRRRLGKVYIAPADVIIRKNPMQTRQPDVFFISNARLAIAQNAVHGGPDLVVEVLSPGNSARKVEEKLRDYAAAGVLEAWIADRKKRQIAVMHPKEGTFQITALYGAKQILRSLVLPRLRLPVRQVFPGEPAPRR